MHLSFVEVISTFWRVYLHISPVHVPCPLHPSGQDPMKTEKENLKLFRENQNPKGLLKLW